MLVHYGIAEKEEAVPILIKARKLMKEQNLSKWDAVDKVVEEAKEKGRINFFRRDGISNNSCYSSGSYHCLQDKEICIIYANFRIT
jgi:hypothetical protein